MSNQLQETQNLTTILKERRSVRHYDSSVKIPREELQEMLQLALTAPSSSNMQPWRFLIIDDQELKEKLLPIAYNQQQVVEASAVIAVLVDMRSYDKASEIYHRTAEFGIMSEEIRDKMIENSVKMYGSLPQEVLRRINTFDAGLISMQLMLIARSMGYDTVPMGGYNAEQFKEAFEVPNTYEPALLIAVGKAAEAGHPSSRLTLDEVAFWNSFK
ncbi:NAD(P)H nitroreductase [Paenibacillus yonginensis]|uniref:NAD(P)H nitroreductase n=1 Tax=Paenibacillus yonginensis TaxID=1462996 RepID=A0A1B1N5J3_9BACL|nr:nitroreductase family protein [Paenibacillus yonginensis]ANS76689.1 NAD(P)H nitroreductase [Paenibacillus yonginensis]